MNIEQLYEMTRALSLGVGSSSYHDEWNREYYIHEKKKTKLSKKKIKSRLKNKMARKARKINRRK